MTCVIAMREPDANVVHMAADRAISTGTGIVNVGAVKLVKFPSGLLVGFAGSLATQNVMVTASELTTCDLGSDGKVSALFNKFQGVAGYQLSGALPKQFWAEMLLAMQGALVYMGNAAGWHRVPEAVRTIGDGGPIALGSWCERIDLAPKERVERAIGAAATFMPGAVSRDCDYEHT